MGDFIEIESGKRPPKKSKYETKECHIPLYGASSEVGFTNDFLTNEKILVIGRVGTHGVIQRINNKAWPSDNTLVIKSKYYETVFQILQMIDYAALNRGSTQPLITQGDLKNCIVPNISSENLGKYENEASKIMELHDQLICESKKLIELRDSLLPRLMSGSIDVNSLLDQAAK